MFLLLNKDNVIIDIVDTVKYVKKNKNNIIVLCRQDEAQGYIGSDGDTIYAKAGSQLIPNYNDIAKWVSIDEVSNDVKPLEYAYDFENSKIIKNTGSYIMDNKTITDQLQNAIANMEYIAIMNDIEI